MSCDFQTIFKNTDCEAIGGRLIGGSGAKRLDRSVIGDGRTTLLEVGAIEGPVSEVPNFPDQFYANL